MFVSLSAIEKIVCLITSFRVNSENSNKIVLLYCRQVGEIFSRLCCDIELRLLTGDHDLAVRVCLNRDIIVRKLSDDLGKISLAFSAMIPLSAISPSIVVSIPSSISLAVSFTTSVEASIRIHSRIGIVVFDGNCLGYDADSFCQIRFRANKFSFEDNSFRSAPGVVDKVPAGAFYKYINKTVPYSLIIRGCEYVHKCLQPLKNKGLSGFDNSVDCVKAGC